MSDVIDKYPREPAPPTGPDGAAPRGEAPGVGEDGEAGDVLAPAHAAEPARKMPAEAPQIGRFKVMRRLGEGGMGVVYSAYDEELDRRIALKLVAGEERDQAESTGRLLREAQAMAKLSHPNVARVYEFGEFHGQIFIAMEYVDGPPLDVWGRVEAGGSDAERTGSTARRPWRELLAMHMQAGRGLSAAHRANLIHRDYKPANVLVGKDGRARVLDFGLVRRDSSRSESDGRSALDRSITRSGSVLGTPAYMSLEQLLGDRADERSDQFSFCVALYEALYGRHPFTDDGVGRVAHIMRGNIRKPPSDTDVPLRVFEVIVRGLSADRKARWSSMDELLSELGDVLERYRELDLDLSVSHRQRQAVFLTLAAVFVFVFAPAALPGVGPDWLRTPKGTIATAGVLNGVLFAMFAIGHRSFLRNQINRWITFWMLLLSAGVLVGRAVGLALAEPYEHLYVQEAVLLAVGTALGGTMIVRWMWMLAVLWLGIGAASAIVVVHAPVLNAAGLFVSAVIAIIYSRRLQSRGRLPI